MPNCDFYALRADATQVLKFIFNETDCQVYELYSIPGEDLRQFKSVDETLAAYDLNTPRPGALLQLYSPSMGGYLSIRQFELDSRKFGPGALRSNTEGWGCIQLYLDGLDNDGIHPSHTNHNSENRALAWQSTFVDRLGPASAWNWRVVTAISSRINRHIRNKLAVSKDGSRPLLPQAFEMLRDGHANLYPY
jgi:hypothetical protein